MTLLTDRPMEQRGYGCEDFAHSDRDSKVVLVAVRLAR